MYFQNYSLGSFFQVFTLNLRLTHTGIPNIILVSCLVILPHLKSAFPLEWCKIFWDCLWGFSNFDQKDTFLIVVCSYWQVPLKSWALKWSCQKTLNWLYSWIMFIFPLVHPCIMLFVVFPFLHPLAVKVPIFFVSPPAVYMTLGDWILLLRVFLLSLGDDPQHSFSTTFFLFPTSPPLFLLKGPKVVHSAPSAAVGLRAAGLATLCH